MQWQYLCISQTIKNHPPYHSPSSQKKGKNKFSHMKATNLYKGEPVKRNRLRFLALCSNLVFSKPKLYLFWSHFYILTGQINYMSTFLRLYDVTPDHNKFIWRRRQHIWFLLLLFFKFLCVKIFVFITLLTFQRILSEQTGNWEAKKVLRALLYWEYLILFFSYCHNKESPISILASVL